MTSTSPEPVACSPQDEKRKPEKWSPTKNPNKNVTPGQMRSDCEEIPEGFTKEQADEAETLEAAALTKEPAPDGQPRPMAAPNCQVYWPAPYEVCGAIRDKYNELGGPNSFLLFPTTNELTNPDGHGKRTVFQNGPIFWSLDGGAHPIANHFFAAWQRNGWEGGVLGYPTSDEIVNPDNIGRRQYFQGGTIYWKLNEAYYVAGRIRDKWGETGWETSYLGYPISDETATADGAGRFNKFEHGVIYWSLPTDAHPVSGGIRDKWATTNFERGPYGYPTSDQRKRGSSWDQDFQGGTLSWPTTTVEGNDTDWAEDFIDDNNCPGCGDDARIAVSGPAKVDVPNEPWPGAGLKAAPGELPSCEQLAPDPSREQAPAWCRPSAPSNEPGLRVRTEWTTALQPFCNKQPAGQWSGDRMYQCMWREDVAYIVNKNNPQNRLGMVKYVEEYELRTAWNRTDWHARSAIHLMQVSGAATEATYRGEAVCTSSGATCSSNGAGDFHNEPIANLDKVVDYTQSMPVGAGGLANAAPFYRFTFVWYDETFPFSSRFATVRCDGQAGRNSVGCAVPGAAAIWDVRPRNVPEFAQHVRNAQISGLPGEPGGTPLTRTTNETTMTQNRNATCNTIPGPRPAGKDCDEYAFASTNQGGNNGGGTLRTYNNCNVGHGTTSLDPLSPAYLGPNGASMCFIDSRQNRRAGGITSWFYVKSRVLDGDPFYVKAG
ncbi:hypothetical protein [Nocardia sp. NPDC050435]|uniref:NucA/NucB deoxyribonuclease domain-containing protein n=1 Tax=Nocardia sp. NPDC050435 TaxID=3155040 RepID=UPI0033CED5CF